MKALTLHQPFAHAVMHLGKNIENRTSLSHWQHLTGQRIAIHAGRPTAWNTAGARAVHEVTGRTITPDDVEYSAVIGTIYVAEVHLADDCCDPWGWEQRGDTMSRNPVVHLELTGPRPCPPIPVRGAQGAWHLPRAIRDELLAATSR